MLIGYLKQLGPPISTIRCWYTTLGRSLPAVRSSVVQVGLQLCVQRTSPGTGPCPEAPMSKAVVTCIPRPSGFDLATTPVTRWEAWRDRLSETQHFRHARDCQKPRRMRSRLVSDLRWGGKKKYLPFYLPDTPYPGGILPYVGKCRHGTPMATLAPTPTVVSDREILKGKRSHNDTVIAHRRRRHLRVYTGNTSVCPDQGAPLLRRPPPRHKPSPSFSHRACRTVLGGTRRRGAGSRLSSAVTLS